MENNSIELLGKVKESFKIEYSAYGENFYSIYVDVKRTSGVTDCLKLICSDRIIDTRVDITGEYINVFGSVRTRNENGHLIITVFVDYIEILNIDGDDVIGENNVCLEGFLCKNSNQRETPFGRKITDSIIAVNNRNGRSYYIPLITWGRNSSYMSSLSVGSKISITGRLQSREYNKPDGSKHIAYEISVQKLENITE